MLQRKRLYDHVGRENQKPKILALRSDALPA